ncbi:flagellar biosynthetic protein FliR [Rhizobium sp. LjRoot30]|uniref:flagellar biosynthetic protein FliR n=1 Tax=Rhizobium sp. LjRoot30 TaxID=3342320 RepID=UPI003ECD54A7
MIDDPQGTVLALFVVLCRVGGCMMVLPGFTSARLPVMIRMLTAMAVAMALLPLLWDTIYPRVSGDRVTFIFLIVNELAVGVMYGMLARFFTLGLQFTGTVITLMIGFNSPPAPDALEDTAENQLTNMISFAGLMVLFALDFHHIVFRAVIDSYSSMPPGTLFSSQKSLITLTDTLDQTMHIMLRLASPFVLYGLMFNLSIGLINKLAPQIPIYFISTPYLLMGGLFMLYLSVAALLRLFANAFPGVFIGG